MRFRIGHSYFGKGVTSHQKSIVLWDLKKKCECCGKSFVTKRYPTKYCSHSEYINKVELQGRVGTVRIYSVSDTLVANFSIYTERVSKNLKKDGISGWASMLASEEYLEENTTRQEEPKE